MENNEILKALNNNSFIISLDISTKCTGYAIFKKQNETYKFINSGCITPKTPKRKSVAKDRFKDMIYQLNLLLQTTNPLLVIVEGTYYSKSFNSIEYPLKIHGFVESYCVLHNSYFVSIKPSSWRKELSFPKLKREALKDYSVSYINNAFNMNIANDNEADAICIGISVLN